MDLPSVHPVKRVTHALSLEGTTRSFPPNVRRWIDRYGITPDELDLYRIVYDPNRDLLLYPIYNGNELVSIHGRYFGTNEHHPRYLRSDFKRGYYPICQNSKPVSDSTVIYVLVEDYISAIKVGRQYSAVCLFGSHYPSNLIPGVLSGNITVRFWLDKDKNVSSIKYAAKAGQFVWDCGTILTEKDPKDYNDQEIKAYVSESISSDNQSILKT